MSLSSSDHALLQSFKSSLSELKLSLTRTPIHDDNDINSLEHLAEEKYNIILSQFTSFIYPHFAFLSKIINNEEGLSPSSPEGVLPTFGGNVPGNVPSAPGGQKAAAKKKGIKEEMQAYESPLKSTTGGVESLVIFPDLELFELPWEALDMFGKVPAISRDFSVQIQVKRLQKIGFNAAANNSNGIKRDSMRYLCYSFKEKEEENNYCPDVILEEFGKSYPNAGFQGVATKIRIPSLGEWQKTFNVGK